METLYLLLAFPLIWPFVAKRIWQTELNWQEVGLNVVIVALVVTGVFFAGRYGKTIDTEIWNGYVISKKREEGSYVRTYSCNCYTTCSGTGSNRSCTESCQTCFEDRYTVDWFTTTTLGKITFQSFDRSSRSVYNEPDPPAYTRCKKGEPVAQERNYTNYVKAVPESLFHDNSKIAKRFAGMIPKYPTVYSFYHINRVINVGTKVSPETITKLNDGLGNMLKELGATKQANIIMILTKSKDPTYRYAIENAWLGGKKNDIVLMMGVDNSNHIVWADVMTWALNAGNELFHVTMRDGLQDIGVVDPAKLLPFINKTVLKLYDRPQMKDYKYLEDEIDPPFWVIMLAFILGVVGSLGLTFYFHREDIDFINNRRGYNRYRRFR